MIRRNASAGFIVAILVLAVWYGGKVTVGLPPGEDWAAAFWLERSHPWLAQAVLGILIAAVAVPVSLRRTVHLSPTKTVGVCLWIAWAWLLVSAMGSKHPHATLMELARWSLLFVWLQALLSTLGRERYPLWALTALVAATSLVALSGVQEYLSPSVPRNWRVFAGWHHPNAAASLFAVILPCSLALCQVARERAARFLSALAFGLIGAGLWLTASKGGLAACAIGLLGLFLLLSWYRVGSAKTVVGALLCATLLTVGVQALKTLSSPRTEAVSRFASTSQEGEQSLAFRRQVWSDTVTMIEDRPILGFGPGTYPSEFKKYSQVQAPVFAHNSYLQLASESGLPPVFLLIVAFFAALFAMVRRNPAQPDDRALLRMGCAASLVVVGANAVVDSTLSVFGYALIAFTLLGVGLLLSADGAQAEKVPIANRLLVVTIPAVFSAIYLFLGFLSTQSASSAYAMAVKEGKWRRPPAFAPLDPTPFDLEGRWSMGRGNPKHALFQFSRAKTLDRAPARHAALAEALDATGEHKAAIRELLYAHEMEPANPRWRALLLDMEIRAGHKRAATKVARELVAMEGSLFFRLRSLPWLVDLSTLEARLFLAERAAEERDSSGQQEHLRVAYQLLLSYRLKTAAELLRQTGLDRVYAARDRLARLKNGPITAYDLANELGLSVQEYGEYINVATHTPLAGETVSQAIERSRQLLEVAQNLARLLREQGREEAASELIQRAQELVLPPIGMEER